MITQLAHICFRAADLEKTEAFYCGALGLKKAFEFKDDNGNRTGLYIHVGGRGFIEVFQGDSEAQPKRHICLEVDDIESTVKSMRDNNVEATDPILGKDQSWQSWITDPDGNKIELHCYTDDSWQTPYLK